MAPWVYLLRWEVVRTYKDFYFLFFLTLIYLFPICVIQLFCLMTAFFISAIGLLSLHYLILLWVVTRCLCCTFQFLSVILSLPVVLRFEQLSIASPPLWVHSSAGDFYFDFPTVCFFALEYWSPARFAFCASRSCSRITTVFVWASFRVI